jgi:prolipoprotein diacylglyceryltransferase
MNKKEELQTKKPDPRQEVTGPSVGLLVTAIIGIIFEFVSFVSDIIGVGIHTLFEYELPERVIDLMEGTVGIAGSFIGILIGAFIIFASLKMKDLKMWSLCIAASILAMIPCVSPCCILGLPFGIWSLVVLTKPEVKAAFTP